MVPRICAHIAHVPPHADLKFSPDEVADVGSLHWTRVKQDLLAQVCVCVCVCVCERERECVCVFACVEPC